MPIYGLWLHYLLSDYGNRHTNSRDHVHKAMWRLIFYACFDMKEAYLSVSTTSRCTRLESHLMWVHVCVSTFVYVEGSWVAWLNELEVEFSQIGWRCWNPVSYVVEVWSRMRDDEKCHSKNHYKGRCVWCKEGRCEEVKESDFSW